MSIFDPPVRPETEADQAWDPVAEEQQNRDNFTKRIIAIRDDAAVRLTSLEQEALAANEAFAVRREAICDVIRLCDDGLSSLNTPAKTSSPPSQSVGSHH